MARGMEARNALLLLTSLFFYTWGETNRIWVLAAVILITYFGGVLLTREENPRKRLAFLGGLIVLDASFLFFFKYFYFSLQIVFGFTGKGESVPDWAKFSLPLGISFFTFQAISYLVDVHRRQTHPARSLKEFALYITLFPHLIAGPIVRFRQIRNRLAQRGWNWTMLNRGLVIFTFGIASKVLIANPLGAVADPLFATPTAQLGQDQAWLGALLFTFQIYFDFQGYSLMAIGLAAMFGIKFPINFSNPYMASGIADFWRRWHISLSSWLRDYVYKPLAVRTRSRQALMGPFLLTFLFSGLWHGANWNFLIWGLFHGALRIAELVGGYQRFLRLAIIGKLWTFLLVMVGWVVFRIQDLHHLGQYLLLMVKGRAPEHAATPLHTVNEQILTPVIALTLAAAALLSFSPAVAGTVRDMMFGPLYRRRTLRALTVASLLMLSLAHLSAQTYNPFIYFRF